MKLEGKKILITGGTRGIGAALARQFTQRGATVAVCGRNRDASAQPSETPYPTFYADLAADSGCQVLFEQVTQSFGRIDVLVNNAAIQHQHDIRARPSRPAMHEELAVNFWAPVQLSLLFLPTLLERPQAAVLNMTTGLVFAPRKAAPMYCASKAALSTFTTSLRDQLRGSNVLVIEALPPIVDTNMTRGRGANKLSPERCARQILQGMHRDRTRILVGRTQLLSLIHRVSPSMAARIMRDA